MFGPKVGVTRISGWEKFVIKFMIFVHRNVLEKFIGYLLSYGTEILKTSECQCVSIWGPRVDYSECSLLNHF
jgi:hypothetical protein